MSILMKVWYRLTRLLNLFSSLVRSVKALVETDLIDSSFINSFCYCYPDILQYTQMGKHRYTKTPSWLSTIFWPKMQGLLIFLTLLNPQRCLHLCSSHVLAKQSTTRRKWNSVAQEMAQSWKWNPHPPRIGPGGKEGRGRSQNGQRQIIFYLTSSVPSAMSWWLMPWWPPAVETASATAASDRSC